MNALPVCRTLGEIEMKSPAARRLTPRPTDLGLFDA